MNHQPFENWILDEEDITKDQKIELAKHLETCSSCASLEKSWKSVRKGLKTAPEVNAPAGFSKRWQSNLSHRKEQERQQRTIMIVSFATTGIAILIALGYFFLPRVSPISLIIGIFTSMIQITSSISQFWVFIANLIDTIPAGLLLIMAISLSLLMSLTFVVWGMSIYRITKKGIRTTK